MWNSPNNIYDFSIIQTDIFITFSWIVSQLCRLHGKQTFRWLKYNIDISFILQRMHLNSWDISNTIHMQSLIKFNSQTLPSQTWTLISILYTTSDWFSNKSGKNHFIAWSFWSIQIMNENHSTSLLMHQQYIHPDFMPR